VSGGAEALLALVKKNIVQASHFYAEAIHAKQQELFDGSTLCAKHD